MIRSNIVKKSAAIFIALLLVGINSLLACELCEKNQPEVLEGATHGTGPQGNMDYVIIWTAVVIVGITLFLSLKYLIRPKETNPNHIKNIVLNPDY